VSDLGASLEASSLSAAIKGADWVIPLLQSIHIVTIGVVFVSSLMIALRVMGRMRADEPFATVWRRFAPWMWYGLIVMVVTGVLLVIGEPVREFTALSFWLKMSLLAIAVTATFVFGRTFGPGGAAHDSADNAAAYAGAGTGGAEFSSGAKLAAAAIMVVWLAIIFLGRAIAYDVEVWGGLSLHT
jgi:uncharacterized membrane protein SirB2